MEQPKPQAEAGAGSSPEVGRSSKLSPAMRQIAPWQVILLGASVAVMVIAGGVWVAQAGVRGEGDANRPAATSPGDQSPGGSLPGNGLIPGGGQGFLPGGTGGTGGTTSAPDAGRDQADAGTSDISAEGATSDAAPVWSPAAFKLGLGFFLGFSLGFAVRIFLKIVMIGLGVFVMLQLGLESLGLIKIQWQVIEQANVSNWLQSQLDSFQTFISGAIPATGSFAAGLAVALRKR